MTHRTLDRKEETFDCLPTADQIAPDKVFGKGEGTAQVLIRLTGMSNKAAVNNLRRLKAEDRAHIHTWTQTQCPSPVWVKGPGEDVPRPVVTKKESIERYRAKQKAEREKRMAAPDGTVASARERTAQTIERAKLAPRDPFAALYDPVPGQT